MSSEHPEPTIHEERIQFRSEKKCQKHTSRPIGASKPRRESSPKYMEFQIAEEVYSNMATGNLTSFFDSGKDAICSQRLEYMCFGMCNL
ncbi:hypothetical protein DRO03_01365 [Methanosarcinales archaeon]|nr:MAG: hypothetical protein DRO03_01365 [Methanosarcinales archaeon]